MTTKNVKRILSLLILIITISTMVCACSCSSYSNKTYSYNDIFGEQTDGCDSYVIGIKAKVYSPYLNVDHDFDLDREVFEQGRFFSSQQLLFESTFTKSNKPVDTESMKKDGYISSIITLNNGSTFLFEIYNSGALLIDGVSYTISNPYNERICKYYELTKEQKNKWYNTQVIQELFYAMSDEISSTTLIFN